ncbi:SET and MYND domain-containing protein 4 [Drosophila grimshawi]|uniref:GH21957 n=1 Tax=Drosophila grimshawi TaxID=7222 RepID=B4J8S9_DROGR|nr:SET and MYND domain-containing protein 4 [Drosophila grimshawi]EDW02369.1 GH21957 [Drosophila grimshawi]
MNRLAEIFSEQGELITHDGTYQNELETIKVIRVLPVHKRQRFNRLSTQLLEDLEQPQDRQKCAERSRSLREEGNRVYKTKSSKNNADQAECLLSACRLYTQAVLEAETAFDELCLSFANRGMALQDYGYYEQAYDDCVCALEFGYPKKLQHKLIMRQAHCAWKLGDAKKLGEHLACLEQLQLNPSYCQKLEELQQQLKMLQGSQKAESTQELQKLTGDTHKISMDSSTRGRYMIATKRLSEGDIIFTEQADCFVPIEQRLICQKCAASLLCAPIPCPQCHQRVVYCSRRCRDLHKYIHSYECAAYRKDLLIMLGVSHLAMRLLLTYLPDWLPQLRSASNAQELWHRLMQMAATDANCSPAPQSLQSMGMLTHLDKLPPAELAYHSLCANLLQVYLFKCTHFYDQLSSSGSTASLEDWHLIVAALILRSAGQLLVNAHVGNAISLCSLPANEFPLLQPALWQGPHHLRRGCLHKFAQSTLQTAINLPYLSLCNHACAPSIHTRFDGCVVSNFATRPIEAGEEIYNCYTLDYRNSMCAQRRQQLESIYKFTCCCDKCLRVQPDQDYLKFHRYRCERTQCGKSFVPNQSSLSWWLQPDGNGGICCSACQTPQLTTWYDQFLALLEHCHESEARRNLYKAFDNLNNWLLDYHSLKLSLANELIVACFAVKEDGVTLDDLDYGQLARIIDFQLAGTAAQYGINSLEYMTKLTHLFDLIAWGKHKCSVPQLKTMRAALNNLPSETKVIFVNYYNDFIEQLCKFD